MKNYIKKQNDAFSLIELLVVIAIMATIISLALPNFLGARARARDTRRKGEMNQVKTALQLYNGDYHSFPADSGGPMYNQIKGCGVTGTTVCPCSATLDFAAGGAGCDTVYMTKLPSEFGSAMFYYSDGTNFLLKVTLENLSDSDIATSYSRCNATYKLIMGVGSNLGSTDYAVCSE